MKAAEQFIDELIQQQALPNDYKFLVKDYIWPLVEDMVVQYGYRERSNKQLKKPWLLGLQGTQGSGKSTVCLFIKTLLKECFNLNVVVLSLDDFYKTHQERLELSKSIHPLFSTRGVPATHDLILANHTLDQLAALKSGDSCVVPSFNKAIDDRTPSEQWKTVSGKVDIIIFEGWCVGLQAQSTRDLKLAINELEEAEDSNCIWRSHVNNQLKTVYSDFYNLIDHLIVLQAPSFDCVYEWRVLQESKLASSTEQNEIGSKAPIRIQSPEQIRRFIAHYERLTRHALKTLPSTASWLLQLNESHNITSLIRNRNLVRLE